MSANLTFNRVSYSPVNNLLMFNSSTSGKKISTESIKIRILVKMDPSHSGPVNGKITCELRHPIYVFQDGSSKIEIPFNNKTNNFSQEFGDKIKFKDSNSTPELPIVIDVSIKDDKHGDIYPEDSEKGKYWWEPVIALRNLQTFI